MIRSLFIGALALILMGSFFSCSKEYRDYRRYSTKGSVEQRDSAAFYFYNRGDYDRAAFLLEDLLGLYRGRPRAEEVLYHLAYSKFYDKLYVMAAYFFEQYVKQYPNTPRTEECTYQLAYCFYLQSDPYYLDQSTTRKAIEQLRIFLVTFPGSDKTGEARSYLTELEERLAHKDYEQAFLYYQLETYKAAVTAFEVFLQEYPDSRYREEGQFMLFKSAVALADASTERRKRNRYLDALDYYERFVDRYPNSTYIKEAENLYVRTKKNLGRFMAVDEEAALR